MQLKALSHLASVAAAAIVGVVLERIRARRNYALIERAPGFKAWRMSKWVKHAGRIETQGLVGTDAASSIADQTAQALAKLDAILTEAGSSRDKLLSVAICVEIKILRRIRAESARPPRHRRDVSTTAWWCGLSPLDSASTASTAALSPRNDLVKN